MKKGTLKLMAMLVVAFTSFIRQAVHPSELVTTKTNKPM